MVYSQMLKKLTFLKSSEDSLDITIKNADRVCKKIISEQLQALNIDPEYEYTTQEAVNELGIDDALVHQLVEDYVVQIMKSILQFDAKLDTLQKSLELGRVLDYTPLRELAHKNLGVARNLRIKNAEVLLYELMKKEDIEYLAICLEALRMCSIRLKPECAYRTLKLIEIKNLL